MSAEIFGIRRERGFARRFVGTAFDAPLKHAGECRAVKHARFAQPLAHLGAVAFAVGPGYNQVRLRPARFMRPNACASISRPFLKVMRPRKRTIRLSASSGYP